FGMRLMSTRARGSASRSFMTGSRLCPPARTFASPSNRSRIWMASSMVAGAKYSKRGGIIPNTSVLLRSTSALRRGDKGFPPRRGTDPRPAARDAVRCEARPVLEISRPQEEIEVGQRLPHARGRGLESRVVGVRVHPDDEMGQPTEVSQGARQASRFPEVPPVAHDHEGG